MVQTLPSKSVILLAVVWLVEVFRSPCADRLLSVHLADLSSAQAFSISPTSRRKAEAKGEGWDISSWPFSCPYSPECVEGASVLKKSALT